MSSVMPARLLPDFPLVRLRQVLPRIPVIHIRKEPQGLFFQKFPHGMLLQKLHQHRSCLPLFCPLCILYPARRSFLPFSGSRIIAISTQITRVVWFRSRLIQAGIYQDRIHNIGQGLMLQQIPCQDHPCVYTRPGTPGRCIQLHQLLHAQPFRLLDDVCANHRI